MKKILFITAVALLSMGNQSCQSMGGNAPDIRWKPPIYTHDHRTRQIHRGNTRIACESERFDDFISMPASEQVKALKEYHRIINLCEKWKK